MNNEIYGRVEVIIENDGDAKNQPGRNKLFAGYRGG